MQKYTKEERQQYKRLYMDIADDIYDSNIVRQDRIIEKINSAVIQGFPVDFYTTPYSVSLLTLAAGHNLENVVNRLLELGADVNIQNRRYNGDNSILWHLINHSMFNSAEIFKKIASRINNINYIDENGQTILSICCTRYVYHTSISDNHVAGKFYMFVKVLLEIGADPNLNTEWEKKIPTDQYASIAKGRLRQLIMSYVTCKMELKDVQTNTYEYEI